MRYRFRRSPFSGSPPRWPEKGERLNLYRIQSLTETYGIWNSAARAPALQSVFQLARNREPGVFERFRGDLRLSGSFVEFSCGQLEQIQLRNPSSVLWRDGPKYRLHGGRWRAGRHDLGCDNRLLFRSDARWRDGRGAREASGPRQLRWRS